MKFKELLARVVESLAPVVSIVIFGCVFYGVIYFLFGWKGLEAYHSLRGNTPLFGLTQLVRGYGTADANDWVGRWDSSIYVVAEDMFKQVYSEEFGQEVEVNLSTAYEFNSDGTFEQKTSKVVRGKGLSLSGSIIIRGTYTLTGDSYLIEIGGLENIEVTGFIPEKNIIELANMTRNGTWVRDGGRLTLTDDDASIVEVLKKE